MFELVDVCSIVGASILNGSPSYKHGSPDIAEEVEVRDHFSFFVLASWLLVRLGEEEVVAHLGCYGLPARSLESHIERI